MRCSRSVLLLVVLLVLASGTAFAAGEGQNTFRLNLSYMVPTSDTTFDVVGTPVKFEVESTLGAGIGYERRVSDVLGVDVNLYHFKPKAKATGPDFSVKSDSSRVNPITLGVNYHFGQTGSMDWYVGPVIGYVFAADLQEKFVWGATAGFDAKLGNGGAGFMMNVKYLAYKAAIDDPELSGYDVSVNPVMVSAGMFYRF